MPSRLPPVQVVLDSAAFLLPVSTLRSPQVRWDGWQVMTVLVVIASWCIDLISALPQLPETVDEAVKFS